MIGLKHREHVTLRLPDIQGNILNAYGRQGFPKGRAILLHVHKSEVGCSFLKDFYPHVTTALRWPSRKPNAVPSGPNAPMRPDVTLNFAFTFAGLLALGVPIRSLVMMPNVFMQGMRARAAILGDNYPPGALEQCDEVWKNEDDPTGSRNVHILALLNSDMDPVTGEPVVHMERLTDAIRSFCDKSNGGIEILTGHGKGPAEYQDMSAILVRDQKTGLFQPVANEHFGFLDGISDPVFEGQFPPETENLRKIGNGKLNGNGEWEPLATGEFLLGYPDEAKELPPAAAPNLFSVNGTFMAYRKLQENVEAFDKYLDETAPAFGQVYGIADPDEAKATLTAKFAGRWQDGVPLVLAPTYADWQTFNANNPPSDERRAKLSHYTYASDPDGAACPASSHIRRVHPRDALGPEPSKKAGQPGPSGTVLVNRRRILRRGLPYDTSNANGERERGIIMLICCANLERQFEFVQQQWLNYGMDNNAGNDTCPMLGARSDKEIKFVIPNRSDGSNPPYICSNLPQFVETKGGAYFFVPSMTSLRMIAVGVIDPT
jgi:Dyp-type peroxidase family